MRNAGNCATPRINDSRSFQLRTDLRDIRKLLAFLLIAACCFQNLVLIDFGAFALKPYHLLGLFSFAYTIWDKKTNWTVPCRLFASGVAIVLAVSVIGYMRFGFNSVAFNYIFLVIICFTLYNLGLNFSSKDWERLLQSVAVFLMGSIFIKLLFNLDAIALYIAEPWMGHPLFPTFFGGGVNLEASWMALFIPFFGWNPAGFAYIGSAFLLSFVYTSRAGLVLAVMGFSYVFLAKYNGKPFRVKLFVLSIGLSAVFVILVMRGNSLIERFLSIGSDPGSKGRLNIWHYALLAFEDAPLFGAGAGNAIKHINILVSTSGILEDNVHMYPMQVLLDFGLVGFVVFAGFVISFFKQCYQDKLSSPFEAWLLFYLVASFIQFRGAEVLLGVCLAGYFHWKSARAVE